MNWWRTEPTPPTAPRSSPWRSDAGYSPGYGPEAIWPEGRRRAEAKAPPHPATHVLLFFLTLFSMMVAGAMQQGVNPMRELNQLVHLVEGWPFAATLLGILTVHEFGHYFAARRWGVKASLPYFIPLPYLSPLGTLGAVIRIRSPIPHKRALLDIGASGPLAGLVVAIVACLVGLPMSQVVEPGYFVEIPSALRPGVIQLGSPLLFQGLSGWLLPATADADLILLSPIAFAGWVGLVITAFNLLPVGQLDGGHIAYALLGKYHRALGRLTFSVLLAMGVYGVMSHIWDLPRGWPGWLLLALLLALVGRDHPPPYHPAIRLDGPRRFVAILCFVAFALCFTLVPLAELAE
jgi:membrane-associated protease RseP (regulator of RpoE activity)